MKLQLLCFLVILAVAAISAEFVCEEHVPYKENKCNNCSCHKGFLACTLMACPWVKENTYDCEVGTNYAENCNVCYCVKGMGTVCTNHHCN
ncbi:hypothetical protein RN001_015499 [Aquatica leii]|uniref:Pacifastin domain-containing protein n=1 Tax=Aquatica leii TaxID=1421715 RepID=A0AAN7PZE8_9COLE|nr:hypothetical protein RN001_015499 [Aquatica leii]